MQYVHVMVLPAHMLNSLSHAGSASQSRSVLSTYPAPALIVNWTRFAALPLTEQTASCPAVCHDDTSLPQSLSSTQQRVVICFGWQSMQAGLLEGTDPI